MTPKQRLISALERRRPDRLPVTTHHVMEYFLETYLGGISRQAFFDRFEMDAIQWVVEHRPDEAAGEFYEPAQGDPGFLGARWIASDRWRVRAGPLPGKKGDSPHLPERPEGCCAQMGTVPFFPASVRYRFATPRGELSTVLQSNRHTSWVTERLVKQKSDIELIGEFCPAPKCDVPAVNRQVAAFGQRGITRGHVCCFDVFGQPGCWQDAACLVGIERLILATYDDPAWVRELLGILQRRKLTYVRSMRGAAFDLIEFGGGDASSTVISPALFDEFVAPYDAPVIQALHDAEQRVVYHTCGGMMPLLERIAAMRPDAMETLTPRGMGGDVDLAEVKRRIGERVCLIGGFDQFHFLSGCTPEQTRAEVRRCYQAAGDGGGYVLCPSDHFFDADPELVRAYAEEGRRCTYE